MWCYLEASYSFFVQSKTSSFRTGKEMSEEKFIWASYARE